MKTLLLSTTIRRADLARIWYLFVKNGSWDGKQIVTPEWVKMSTTPAVDVGGRGTGIKYGLKWWLYPYGDGTKYAWAGSGFGGQVPMAFPDEDLVVVFNAWNVPPVNRGIPRQAIFDNVLGAIVK